MATEEVRFYEFCVDVRNERLWRGREVVPLPPRVFALLRYLVGRPNTLVTKAELFEALWPKMVVEDAVLTVAIGELRRALGDDPRQPQFIETVHRRGYRFLAPTSSDAALLLNSRSSSDPPFSVQIPSLTQFSSHPSHIVGREAELAQLQHCLENVLGGERRIVFLTGEPGIGKTAVVEAFLEQVTMQDIFWLGQGQCIEHYGVGEAYLPVLDLLGQLGRQPGGEQLVTLLRRYAPTWLVQLPGVVAPTELEELQRLTPGVTRERMLREIAEALEALSTHQPLVLVFEDLQWSDYSTVEFLSFLARRRRRARLLVVGTYRPVDLIVREHPLKAVKQELKVHEQCQEIAVSPLSEADIKEYLAQHFPVQYFPTMLPQLLLQRTEGNPLFLENLVRDWQRQGVLLQDQGQWMVRGELETVAKQIPQSLRALIEQQLERLSPVAHQLLEVASLVGEEFSAALVAAGLERPVVEVEAACEEATRRDSLLQERGIAEWPDGTVASRYGFYHALYREVLLAQVPAARRVQLHQRLAARLEAAYADRTEEVAAEVAVHCEQGREYDKAIQYRGQAAQRALQRSAHVEALVHAKRGLELLASQTATPERWQQELIYQLTLATVFRVTKGYGADETLQALLRAQELCEQLDAQQQLFVVQLGLIGVYIIRADYQIARDLAEKRMHTAESESDISFILLKHMVVGFNLLQLGELVSARAHFEQGITLYSPQSHNAQIVLFGQDFGVSCLAYETWVLCILGYPDQALKRAHEALTLAQKLAHPYSKALALAVSALIHDLLGVEQTAQERSDEVIALSREQEFPLWLMVGMAVRGLIFARRGQYEDGLAQLHQSIADSQVVKCRQGQPRLLGWLAEAYGYAGQAQEGLKVLAEALHEVNTTKERLYEAELHRLTGEVLLKQAGRRLTPRRFQEAEVYFLTAIEVARHQEARFWELRATVSLSRLWQRRGKKAEAWQLLAEIYNWFTEGFDMKDLQEAKALLAELS